MTSKISATKPPAIAQLHKTLKEQGLGSVFVGKPFLVVPNIMVEKVKQFYGNSVDVYESKKAPLIN